jgi:membrane-associated protein
MTLSERILDFIARNPHGAGFWMLGGAACIEYLFPPFPGDLIVVFGAFLVTRRGWPALPVFAAVMIGSMVGFMIDYAAGRALAGAEDRWATGRLARYRPRIDALIARFARHGALYITLNRFLPSVRAFFFVAAGMARLDPWKVLAAGAASAAIWNALLLAAGATVGSNWDRLRVLLERYSLIVTGALLLVALALGIRWWLRRRKSRQ